MTCHDEEHLIKNLDRRLTNAEQILPTLATKEDLKAFATKEDLKAYPTKEDVKAHYRRAAGRGRSSGVQQAIG